MFDSLHTAELTKLKVCRDGMREEIILYPDVEERFRKRSPHYRTGHRPKSIPSERV